VKFEFVCVIEFQLGAIFKILAEFAQYVAELWGFNPNLGVRCSVSLNFQRPWGETVGSLRVMRRFRIARIARPTPSPRRV